jgi:carbonic anhydrase/acetyltransferase-like protein (isoleucine patch superfamily)
MIYQLGDRTPTLPEEYYVADSARVIGDVTLHHQASIWFGTVLRGDIEPIVVGERSNIQDNSVAHTSHGLPVVIGRDVTVGHHVTLHGCTIGNNCLIGMGAILLDGSKIGDNCLIGAGALVKQGQEIPAGSMAVGSPARVVRQLSPEEIGNIHKSAKHYVGYYREYLNGTLRSL